jgi:hypothetical protein
MQILANVKVGKATCMVLFAPEGEEIAAGAGSVVRESDGWLARVVQPDGTLHGQWFRTEADAMARHERHVSHLRRRPCQSDTVD